MENSNNLDDWPSRHDMTSNPAEPKNDKNVESKCIVSKDKTPHEIDEINSRGTENTNNVEIKDEKRKSIDCEVSAPQLENVEQINANNEIILKTEDEFEDGQSQVEVNQVKIEIERSVGLEVLSNYLGIRPNNVEDSILPTTQQDAFGLLKATQVSMFREMSKPTYTCLKCSAVLHTLSSYKQHMTKHRKQEKKELCKVKRNETMKRQRELQGNEPYKCEECGKTYFFAAGLKSHIRKTHKPVVLKDESHDYPCPCGKVFTRKSRMETCYKRHSIQLQRDLFLQCPRCKQHFKNQNDLAYHKKLAHWPKRYLCKFCPMEYPTLKELFDHLEVHRSYQVLEYKFITDVVEGKQDLKCIICEKISLDILELKNHILDDHRESYSCTYCDNAFMNIKGFVSHIRSSHPKLEQQSLLDFLEAYISLADTWKCDMCDVQYETPEQMADHYIQHRYINVVRLPLPEQEEDRIPEWKFQCKDCKRLFWTTIKLKSHKIRNHDIFNPYTEIPLLSNLSFICIYCKKQCENKTTLDKHMQLHSGDRKYICKYCNFRFSSLEKKVAHESIHTGDQKYVCFICEYKCDTEGRQKWHKSTESHRDMENSLLNGTFFQPKPEIAEIIIKQEIMEEDDYDDYDGDPNVEAKQDEEGGSIDYEGLHPCEVCGECFENAEHLSEHKKTHPFITVVEDAKATIFFN
ncbi:Zinc finger protein 62 [Eumeta japonica]|uniref:Zinc finger protein 62 n=1 Tax=Eumeta variegata TaxID=151549 RepID=A0A4C1UJZ7_EUMVA|nr:Zinc finger protein 62 [Eumeta japonica]